MSDNGLDIDIGAKIEVALGNLAKAFDKNTEQHRIQEQAKKYDQPALIKLPWSGVCNASGFGIFLNSGQGIEGPDMGWIWFVRRISVLGTVVGTAITGRFDVFISAMDYPNSYNNINQLPTLDWADGSNSIPNNAFYGRGEMPLRLNESLTFVVSGAPANQQVGGLIVIEQFQEAAMKEEWSF